MALKVMRDNIKSLVWVLWAVILALVFLVFFEWGGFNQAAGTTNDVAATIGEQEITFGEFQSYYRTLEGQYKQAFGEQWNDDMARQFNLHMQALNQLINQRILLAEAQRAGLEATDVEVRDRILTYPYFQRDGRFIGKEEYEEILRRSRTTPAEFHASIREELLLEKLDGILTATAYVSDADVERAYRDQVERAKVRFLELPASQMPEAEVERSELIAFLEENAEDFQIPERRAVDYLLVDTGKLRQQIEVTEEELRAYYAENEQQYTRTEQVRARHILRKVGPERDDATARAEIEDAKRRLEAGEDFAALATELSEDEVSARSGGMLRPFGRGEMVPPFEEAVWNAADGAVVGPVQTSFGYHLIERLGYTPAGLQPFEEVQAAIRARLLSERSASLAQEKSLEVAALVTPEMSGDELSALAEQEGVELITTASFADGDTVEGLGRSPSFTEAAFRLETVGAVSEPIRVPRGWAVVRLKEIEAPRSPELAEVEDDVKTALAGERRKEAALARLRQAVDAGTSLDELGGELGIEVKESAEFGRTGSIASLTRSGDVIEAAFALDVGQTGGPLATDQGAVVFEVTEKKEFDPVEFEAQKASTRASQEQKRLQELKQSIVVVRRAELPPDFINPRVYETFEIPVPGPGQG